MPTVELENFPPGNPFIHDTLSVGINIGDYLGGCFDTETKDKLDDWYIMVNGWNTDHLFYLVNHKTGERIGVK